MLIHWKSACKAQYKYEFRLGNNPRETTWKTGYLTTISKSKMTLFCISASISPSSITKCPFKMTLRSGLCFTKFWHSLVIELFDLLKIFSYLFFYLFQKQRWNWLFILQIVSNFCAINYIFANFSWCASIQMMAGTTTWPNFDLFKIFSI